VLRLFLAPSTLECTGGGDGEHTDEGPDPQALSQLLATPLLLLRCVTMCACACVCVCCHSRRAATVAQACAGSAHVRARSRLSIH
jgi:hypothetical protein